MEGGLCENGVMTARRPLHAAIRLLPAMLLMLLTTCSRPPGQADVVAQPTHDAAVAAAPDSLSTLTVLEPGAARLRSTFNAHLPKLRLLTLLSPT